MDYPKGEKIRTLASNYSTKEKILYFRDRVFLPTSFNKKNFPKLITTKETFSNTSDDHTQTQTVAFIGDIMPINDKNILLDDMLKEKLQNVDLLVVNLEGVLTDKKRFLALSHHESILEKIRKLTDAEILVNIANNHAGDFGTPGFHQTIQKLNDFGYEAFGFLDVPFVEKLNMRFFSSSLWSNQKFYKINRFSYDNTSPVNTFLSQEHLNVFLPHWGYEMQLYPSKKQVQFAQEIMKKWDIVIGCHSHCPQPIVKTGDQHNSKLLAYSMGNFCYSHYNTNHYCGAVVIAKFNSMPNSKPKLKAYEYLLTEMSFDRNNILISNIEQLNYGRLRLKKATSFSRA